MIDIQPIKRNRLVPQVMEGVKDYILSNNLETGSRLPTEKQFSEMLGVSKTILREALKSLEAVGIIEINVGNGMFVSDIDYPKLVGHLSYAVRRSPQDFRHLVTTRILLEVGSLDDVLKNMQEDDFVRLADMCDKLAIVETLEEYLQYDMGFHRDLLSCCQNPFVIELSSFFSEFSARVAPIVDLDAMHQDSVQDSQNHRMILETLKRGDLNTAKDLLRQHIEIYMKMGVIADIC